MILVSQDAEGIRMAALEVFELSLQSKSIERRIQNIRPDDLEQIVKIIPERKLSPGYYEFLMYLLWLEGQMEAGCNFALNADEADGLRAVQQARHEFDREHPACGNCGTPRASVRARRCESCMREF